MTIQSNNVFAYVQLDKCPTISYAYEYEMYN